MIVNPRTGAVLADRPVVADTVFARLRGLLGRRGLDPGEALVLRPCPSVHMFFMAFPLDVAFVDGDGKVVALYPDLRPWSWSGYHAEAVSALEFPVGTLAASGTEVGDRLDLEVGSDPAGDPAASEREGSEADEEPDRAGSLVRVAAALILLVASLLQIAEERTYLLTLAVLTAGGAIAALWTRRLAPPPAPLAALALWVTVQALSVLVSPVPYAGRHALARRATQAGALVVGMAAASTSGGPTLVAGTLAATGAVSGLVALDDWVQGAPTLSYWLDAEAFVQVKRRIAGLYVNPNLLGLYHALVLPVCLGLAARATGPARLAALAATGLTAVGLGMSYSRSAWVALVGGLLVLVLAYPRRRQLLLPAGLALVVALASAPGLFERAVSTADPGEFGIHQRIEVLRGNARMIQAAPWLGHGPGSFRGTFPQYRTLGGQYPLDAHGQFLQEAVEGGLPGIALFLVLLSSAASAGLRVRHGGDPDERAEGAGFLAAGAVFATACLFTSPLAWTPVAVPFMLAIGAAAGGRRSDGEPGTGAPDLGSRLVPRRSRDRRFGEGTRWLLASVMVAGIGISSSGFVGEGLREGVRAGIRGVAAVLARRPPGTPVSSCLPPGLAETLLADLDAADRVDPGGPVTAHLRAELLRVLERRPEAEAAYREVLVRDPGESLAWKGISRTRSEAGDPGGAREAILRALELDPWAEDLMVDQARILVGVGRVDEAGEVLERALRTNEAFLGRNHDTYPRVVEALIGVRELQGRTDEAEGLRQLAARLAERAARDR